MIKYSFLDKMIEEVDCFFQTMDSFKHSTRISPAESYQEYSLSQEYKKHITGLMRVDHTGEVCAQALYRSQALVAKEQMTKDYLYHSADEEYDHLFWCKQRLNQLDVKTSLLNPLWYIGSYFIGATAGIVSDKLSLGFIVETEKQVMKHLEEHLGELSIADKRSQAILEQMRLDEMNHHYNAKEKGGIDLPLPIKKIMKAQAKIMTTLAYKI